MYMKCLSLVSICFLVFACESQQKLSEKIDTVSISKSIDLIFEEALVTSLSKANFSKEVLEQFMRLKALDIKTFPDLYDRYLRLRAWLVEKKLVKTDETLKSNSADLALISKIHLDQSLSPEEEQILAKTDDWTIDTARALYHFKNSLFGEVLADLVVIKSKHSIENPAFEIAKKNLELAFELGLTHIESALDLSDASLSFERFYRLVENETGFTFESRPEVKKSLDQIIERLDLAITLVGILNSKRPELEIEKRIQKILAAKKSLIADLEPNIEGYGEAVIAVERAIMDLPDGKNFYPYQAVEPQKALAAFKKLLKLLGQ